MNIPQDEWPNTKRCPTCFSTNPCVRGTFAGIHISCPDRFHNSAGRYRAAQIRLANLGRTDGGNKK